MVEDGPQTTHAASGPRRVLRPRRATSRYSSHVRSCQASTTSRHSDSRNDSRKAVSRQPTSELRLREAPEHGRRRNRRRAARRFVGLDAHLVDCSRTAMRSSNEGSSLMSRFSFLRSVRARAMENVVSSTRASVDDSSPSVPPDEERQSSSRCRLSQLPEPDRRSSVSTVSRCAGCRNTAHLSQGYSSARSNSLLSATSRKRR